MLWSFSRSFFLAYFHRKQGTDTSLTNRSVKDKRTPLLTPLLPTKRSTFPLFFKCTLNVCKGKTGPVIHADKCAKMLDSQVFFLIDHRFYTECSAVKKTAFWVCIFVATVSSPGREYPSCITLLGNPILCLPGQGGCFGLVSGCQTLLWKIISKQTCSTLISELTSIVETCSKRLRKHPFF